MNMKSISIGIRRLKKINMGKVLIITKMSVMSTIKGVKIKGMKKIITKGMLENTVPVRFAKEMVTLQRTADLDTKKTQGSSGQGSEMTQGIQEIRTILLNNSITMGLGEDIRASSIPNQVNGILTLEQPLM